jgi:hypothetical protein
VLENQENKKSPLAFYLFNQMQTNGRGGYVTSEGEAADLKNVTPSGPPGIVGNVRSSLNPYTT